MTTKPVPQAKPSYHHGDLKATILAVAMQQLEQGEPFSLRAIARDAGVSPTAPYRHFADRDALESALAAIGFVDLKRDLLALRDSPSTPEDLAEYAVGYVDFALRRPALFRLMFGNQCDHANDDRVQAVANLREILEVAVKQVLPDAPVDLPAAYWALAHGLACLHLDRKLEAASAPEREGQVRSAFRAVLGVHA